MRTTRSLKNQELMKPLPVVSPSLEGVGKSQPCSQDYVLLGSRIREQRPCLKTSQAPLSRPRELVLSQRGLLAHVADLISAASCEAVFAASPFHLGRPRPCEAGAAQLQKGRSGNGLEGFGKGSPEPRG